MPYSLVVKKDEFESTLLDLWMTTAIPLTVVNLQYHTGASRRNVQKWLDQMVRDGHLDMDSDDEGELVFHVLGSRRPTEGPRTFAERDRLHALTRQVQGEMARKNALAQRSAAEAQARRDQEQAALMVQTGAKDAHKHKALERLRSQYNGRTALSIAHSARQELEKGPGQGKKSLLLSGALSFFFGPLGWLYAGSLREAIPAGAAFLLISYLLPTFLLLPLAGIALPVSGIAGLVYAWQYNRTGKRDRILGEDDA
jgi:hypothetical protein